MSTIAQGPVDWSVRQCVDARVRHQLAPPADARELPAEIDLGGAAGS